MIFDLQTLTNASPTNVLVLTNIARIFRAVFAANATLAIKKRVKPAFWTSKVRNFHVFLFFYQTEIATNFIS